MNTLAPQFNCIKVRFKGVTLIWAVLLRLFLQDNTIVVFFSNRNGSVDTFGSSDFRSFEIECRDIADSGIERTVSNLLGAT